MKVFGSCAFLEKYGTKRFGAGVSVYFHLSAGAAVVYLEHGRRDNATFKFLKRCLTLFRPRKLLIFACQLVQRFRNSTKIADELTEILYKSQE